MNCCSFVVWSAPSERRPSHLVVNTGLWYPVPVLLPIKQLVQYGLFDVYTIWSFIGKKTFALLIATSFKYLYFSILLPSFSWFAISSTCFFICMFSHWLPCSTYLSGWRFSNLCAKFLAQYNFVKELQTTSALIKMLLIFWYFARHRCK